jgi:ribonuclease HII
VIHVGVDENGLGPRLGPLVVTAVTARVHGSPHVLTSREEGVRLGALIGDSKRLVSFSDDALGEAWARELVGGPSPGGASESPDDVVRALCVEPRASLEADCPGAHRAQCWEARGERFAADAGLARRVTGARAELRQRGVELLGAHVVLVCCARLNDGASRGVSRFQADLFAMERLLLHVREAHREEIDATCGKVGGYACYPPAFGPLSGRLLTTLEEGQARSAYRVADLGHIAFVRDADDGHLAVSLASLVGKWVRDLLTRRVTRYHREDDPSLPEVSGYQDPLTRRFVEASAEARRRRGVPDDCFERRGRSPEISAKRRRGQAPRGA